MSDGELRSHVRRWQKDPAHFARSVLGVRSLWRRQIEILEALRDCRRVAVPSCHESGKALALDTPLAAPGGWTTMGEVRVGDRLLDEEGRPCRVTATSPVHERDVFRVRFSDGTEVVASDDHRWALLDGEAPRGAGWDATRIVTTAEVAAAGAARWSLPPGPFFSGPRTLVGVPPAGRARVRCVAVDSPRRLYLAGSGRVPTHNTFVASVAVAWHLLAFQPSKVITTAPTQRQVRDLLWSEVRARHAGMLRTLGGDPGLGAPTLTHWEIPGESDWFATGFATSPDKASESASRLHGYHSSNLLVILDEAGGIAREVWSAIDGLLTSQHAKVLAIGNPAGSTEFERVCRSSDWRVLPVSAYDCPNLLPGAVPQPWGVTREWVEEMRRRWGEESVVFQTKVLGRFPETSTDTLISIAEVERAIGRLPPQEGREKVTLGVDVARFGSDQTVIYVLRGSAVLAVEMFSGQDTMRTAGAVIRLAKDHGLWMPDGSRIAVDDTGVGGGVVDRLREQGWNVRAVNFGSAPERSNNTEKFTNRRTEMWWNLREWVRKDAALGDVRPEVLDCLRADLTAPKYDQRSDGRIALESKDRIRDRTGRSPDHGDALALALVPRATRPFPYGKLYAKDPVSGEVRPRRGSFREELDRICGPMRPIREVLGDW